MILDEFYSVLERHYEPLAERVGRLNVFRFSEECLRSAIGSPRVGDAFDIEDDVFFPFPEGFVMVIRSEVGPLGQVRGNVGECVIAVEPNGLGAKGELLDSSALLVSCFQPDRQDYRGAMLYTFFQSYIVGRSDPQIQLCDGGNKRSWSEEVGSVDGSIALAAVSTALSFCVAIGSPSRWVVRRHGDCELVRKVRRGHKIARSNRRPIYLLITDQERERIFRMDQRDGKASSPTPHARRAHWRRIGEDPAGDPVYTRVKACWVGPKEAQIGGQRYEVQLDL